MNITPQMVTVFLSCFTMFTIAISSYIILVGLKEYFR